MLASLAVSVKRQKTEISFNALAIQWPTDS